MNTLSKLGEGKMTLRLEHGENSMELGRHTCLSPIHPSGEGGKLMGNKAVTG